jgi:hypothetical protein
MARVVLHDDPIDPAFAERGPGGFGTRVGVSGDVPLTVGASPFPVLTLLVRSRSGYDDDGVPEYEWSPLLSEVATLYTARLETSDPSGETYIVARAVVLYSGDEQVPETSMVTTSYGDLFRVTKVTQTPDRIELEMDQVVNDG